jgi:uncharacterized protein (TIGR00730 family)
MAGASANSHVQRVCVYCGSRPGDDPIYAATAEELARLAVARGLGIVYGGGKVGLMGVVADAALDAGGEVIGVIPRLLADREVAHGGLTELRIVDSMHARKQQMTDLSDAFVILPGGIGTLDELVEAFTWTQLLIHDKPIALLNVAGYYDRLLAFLDHAVQSDFLVAEQRATLIVRDRPQELLDELTAWYPGKRFLSNSSPGLLAILLLAALIVAAPGPQPGPAPNFHTANGDLLVIASHHRSSSAVLCARPCGRRAYRMRQQRLVRHGSIGQQRT